MAQLTNNQRRALEWLRERGGDGARARCGGPGYCPACNSDFALRFGPLHARIAAAEGVLTERKRQIETEGWTAEHDDEHRDDQLVTAALSYAIAGMCADDDGATDFAVKPPAMWPWSEARWKPKNRRRDLERAAALLLAEIERLDRAAARAATGTQGGA